MFLLAGRYSCKTMRRGVLNLVGDGMSGKVGESASACNIMSDWFNAVSCLGMHVSKTIQYCCNYCFALVNS